MATIQAKTISQLDPASTSDIKGSSLFYMSVLGGDVMTSKSLSYTNFKSKIQDDVDTTLASRYGLKDGSTKLNLKNINTNVNSILSGNQIFSGPKTFVDDVQSTFGDGNGQERDPKSFVRLKDVSDIVGQSAVFLRNTSDIREYRKMSFDNTDLTTTTSITTDKSGLLVIYGWLADNGNVYAHQAWVALEANINNVGWTKVAVQPWNISTHSSAIQYVGFNVMVGSDVKFRIKTGFAVNSSASALDQQGSLVENGDGHCIFKVYQFVSPN